MYRNGRRSIANCHRVVQEIAAKIPDRVNAVGAKIRDALNVENYLQSKDSEYDEDGPYLDWNNSVVITPLKGLRRRLLEDQLPGREAISDVNTPSTTTAAAAGGSNPAFPILKYRPQDMPSNRLQCTCLPSADVSSCPPSTQRSTNGQSARSQHGKDTQAGALRYAHVQPYINYQYDGEQHVRELPGFTVVNDQAGTYVTKPEGNAATDSSRQRDASASAYEGRAAPAERRARDTSSVGAQDQQQVSDGEQNLREERARSMPTPDVHDGSEPPLHAQADPSMENSRSRTRYEDTWWKHPQRAVEPIIEAPQTMTTANAASERDVYKGGQNGTCATFQSCPVHGAPMTWDPNTRGSGLTYPAVQIYPIGERRTKIFTTNKKLTAGDDVKHWRRIGDHADFDVIQLPSWCPPPAPPPLNAQFMVRR